MAHSPLKFTQSVSALFRVPAQNGERIEAYLYRLSGILSSASSFPFDLEHLRVDFTDLPVVGDFAFARHASAALDKVFDNYDDDRYVLMADSHRGMPDGFMLIMRTELERLSQHVASALRFLKTPRIMVTGSRRQQTGFIGIPLTAFVK
jgi:hypothetical protein